MKPQASPVLTAPRPARVRSPASLILLALVWLGLAIAGSFASVFLVALSVSLHNSAIPASGGLAWRMPGDVMLALLGGAALQLILLFAALHRARIEGGGSRSAGFGNTRIERPGLITALALLLAGSLGALVILAAYGFVPVPRTGLTKLTAQIARAGIGIKTATCVLVVVLAPIAEECFFRGWLWTALRQFWAPGAVILCTSLLWLGVHALDSPSRPLFLLPAGVILGLARHFGASIRASLAIHVFNNALIVALVALAYLMQH
ncbi:MAG: CPBP family intramembrane metalloprotease [Acetobacteraceae bacterium]|nr:CPBP family intramembrane metalloprotease [Acetobacteraceae bacterium]